VVCQLSMDAALMSLVIIHSKVASLFGIADDSWSQSEKAYIRSGYEKI
jgi:hypothetical protein